MGTDDQEGFPADGEGPVREIAVDPFYMDMATVTNRQFSEFISATGYQTDAERFSWSFVFYGLLSDEMRESHPEVAVQAPWWCAIPGATWDHPEGPGTGIDDRMDHPVVHVSWNDAMAYAAWLSERTGKRYRLPSEAEFEYTLRGGTTTPYWWGAGAPDSKVGNLTGSGDRSRSGRRWSNAFRGYRDGYWGPAPVRSFAANPFGLYDIDGNVSEWVADCWHDNYIRAPDDGSAWINPGCSTRVLRGGSWGSSPDQVISAYRQGAASAVRSGRVGFRVVREL